MRTFIFSLIILSSVSILKGQNPVFDYYFKTEWNDRIVDAAEDDNGNYYLLVQSINPYEKNQIHSRVVKLNYTGEFVKSSDLGFPNEEYLFTNILKVSGDKFIVAGSFRANSSSASQTFLMKIDDDLDKVWLKLVGSELNNFVINKVKLSRNKDELIAIGDGPGSTAFIAKFDINGNRLFHKIYNFNHWLVAFFDCLELMNGGFYIITYGTNMPNEPPQGFTEAVSKLLVLNKDLKVDTVLPLRTSLTYPHFNGFVSFTNYTGARWISNDKFVLGGNIHNPSTLNLEYHTDLGLMCWDTNYSEVYYRIFGEYRVREASQWTNLDFIDTSNIYFVGTNGASLGFLTKDIIDFYVIKTNSLGKVKWEKTFSNNSLLFHMSILATSDGGLLVMGYSYKKFYNQPDEADGYVLKIDSNGFAEIWPVGVEENQALKHRIYPNPVQTSLTLEVPSSGDMYHFELFDQLGKKVFDGEFKSEKLVIDATDLKRGLFIYTLTSKNGGVARGKLVKE